MRPVGIHTNAVDYAVDADPGGESFERLHRIFFFKVDALRALVSRHVKPAGNRVNGKDPPGVQQARAGDGELPHRAGAKHSNGAAGMNFGELSSHVTGGKKCQKAEWL